MSNVVLFEDFAWQKLLPLVYLRPVYGLLCGSMTLAQRVARLVGNHASQSTVVLSSELEDGRRVETNYLSATSPLEGTSLNADRHRGLVEYWCRPWLKPTFDEQQPDRVNRQQTTATLFLNGRGIWSKLPEWREETWVGVDDASGSILCVQADAELAGRMTPEVLLDEVKSRAVLAGLPRYSVGDAGRLVHWLWELVDLNTDLLVSDWRSDIAKIAGNISPGSHLLNRDAIHIGSGSKVKPCAVIDAEDGPVWIGENVTIFPHTYIQGPAWIGNGSLIQPGAVVHAGTTIGPVSKIGGEIEGSIIQGYSNKQHDGFLGHSYVGSWVNIAADCINSDLKNTYGNIRVPVNGRNVETGKMFVGMFVGDYSKAGINVSFPTGSVIGFCSSVIAPRSPKFVPSFTWIDGDEVQRYDEQRGLVIARKVMARRKQKMSSAQEQLFLSVRKQALAIERQSFSLSER